MLTNLIIKISNFGQFIMTKKGISKYKLNKALFEMPFSYSKEPKLKKSCPCYRFK